MKTYKAIDNSLHVIEPEFAYLLPAGCTEITEEEAEAIRIANTPALQAPKRVTMRQARLVLLNAGLLSAVNTAIANMPGIEGEAARIEWDYSNEVVRNQPLTLSLASALGLTPEQMDALFVQASTL